MKIVYLNPVGALGGAERSLLDLLASVRQADPSVRLHVIVGTDGPLIELIGKLGAEASLLAMPEAIVRVGDSGMKDRSGLRPTIALARRGVAAGWATWDYARRLGRALTVLQPDVIHSNGIKFHLLTRLIRTHRRPVLWHLRDFLADRPVMARALRWASSRPQAAIAISRGVEEDARRVLPRLPVNVMYNAVDTDHFSPSPMDSSRLDELAGIPPAARGVIRVGLPATFASWKGHQVFLEAATQIIREQPQTLVRFYIIGGPIYSTTGSQFSKIALKAKAAALGIEQEVGFIDFQHDTADIYRALDIVIHASTKPEPFGRTIVEAMACAKPVIVSQAGGAAELFTHDYDAVGVPPGDARALAMAIHRLVQDGELRSRLAANARRTAVQRFARNRLGPETLKIYQRLLRAPLRDCN